MKLALVFFGAVFLLTSAGFDTSEGVYHYRISRQILTRGALGFDGAPPASVYFQAPNGRSYAAHEIGNSLLLLPAAALSIAAGFGARVEDFVVAVQAALFMAVTAALFFGSCVRFGLARRQALWATAAVFATSLLWTYSRNLFDGVGAGMLLTASFLLLLGRRIVPAFVVLGFAVITRTTLVLAVLSSLVYVMMTETRRARAVALALASLAPFAAWQLYYNHLRGGQYLTGPIHTGAYNHAQTLGGFFGDALPGFLVSPGKSIFVFAPLLVISVLSFPAFWRRERAAAVYVASLGGGWLMTHAMLTNWQGTWGWGPRYFVTIMPILSLPAALALGDWWRRRRLALVGLAAFGFALAAASIVGNWHFRMGLAAAEHRLDQMDWSLSQNQASDMLRGAARNIGVVVGARAPERLSGQSEANMWASNTVNVWELSMARAGVPKAVIAVAVLALLAAAWWAGRRLSAPDTPSRRRENPPAPSA